MIRKLTLIGLCVLLSCCRSQVMPVEDAINYLRQEKGIPESITYIKDVNNLFDKFIGTWVTTYEGNTMELVITEYTHISDDGELQKDMLLTRFKITDGNDNIIKDTTPLPDDNLSNMRGRYFTEDEENYVFSYYGDNFKCGEHADVLLRVIPESLNSLSGAQMEFYLIPTPRTISSGDCNAAWTFLFPKRTLLVFSRQ